MSVSIKDPQAFIWSRARLTGNVFFLGGEGGYDTKSISNKTKTRQIEFYLTKMLLHSKESNQ
jgi:hypothetical protein